MTVAAAVSAALLLAPAAPAPPNLAAYLIGPDRVAPGSVVLLEPGLRGAPLEGAAIRLRLPEQLTFDSAGDQPETRCTTSAGGRVVDCPVLPGGIGGFAVNVRVADGVAAGTRLRVEADAVPAGPDADPADDTATLDVTVVAGADLSARLERPVPPVPRGGSGTFTVILRNDGPDPADTVIYEEGFADEAFDVLGVVGHRGRCGAEASYVQCQFGPLAPGAQLRVVHRFTVARDAPGTTTTVRGEVRDSVPLPPEQTRNNVVAVTVPITAARPSPSGTGPGDDPTGGPGGTPGGGAGGLPVTGPGAATVVAAGLAAVLAGAGLRRAARRRRG